MRKLLLISYYFPPILSAEGTMTLNYVKYLHRFGWTPIVLCGKPSVGEPIDYSNMDKILPNIRIYRIKSLENIIINSMRGMKILSAYPRGDKISKGADAHRSLLADKAANFARSIKFLPSRIVGWALFAVVWGMKAFKKGNVEIIISRSTPVNSHFAALVLKSLSGLPWIACFSDPWTTDPNLPYRNKILPEKLIKRYDEFLERKVISIADRVIFTTERMRGEYVHRYKYICKDKFVVIPNSHDYKQPFETANIDDVNNTFTITYAGIFANTRSPEPLFKALKLLKDESNIYTKLNVRLIGKIGNFENLIHEYGLTDVVKVISTVPHKEVSHYLYSSDVLLLIDAPNHTMCLPSKLVEYIFIGKPILAITLEEGSSADVIRETKTGIVVSPQDIEGIKDTIKTLYRDYRNGCLEIKPDWDEIKKYSAENCTQTLVKTIESLIDQHKGESTHANR